MQSFQAVSGESEMALRMPAQANPPARIATAAIACSRRDILAVVPLAHGERWRAIRRSTHQQNEADSRMPTMAAGFWRTPCHIGM